jgi:carbon-monoxide dehydrogenase iron sulfur subunit
MKVEGIVIIPRMCRGCRSCQLACSYVRHGVFNPAKSVIVMDREVETDHTVPVILPLSCDLCGGDPACLRACPYGAIVANTEQTTYKILVQT